MEVFGLALQACDRSKLAKDILWAISRLGDGKKFICHDGREYAIVSGDHKPESKSFIDAAMKVDGEDKAVASYAIVSIGISPNERSSEHD